MKGNLYLICQFLLITDKIVTNKDKQNITGSENYELNIERDGASAKESTGMYQGRTCKLEVEMELFDVSKYGKDFALYDMAAWGISICFHAFVQ